MFVLFFIFYKDIISRLRLGYLDCLIKVLYLTVFYLLIFEVCATNYSFNTFLYWSKLYQNFILNTKTFVYGMSLRCDQEHILTTVHEFLTRQICHSYAEVLRILYMNTS